jgi:hypothetical protein
MWHGTARLSVSRWAALGLYFLLNCYERRSVAFLKSFERQNTRDLIIFFSNVDRGEEVKSRLSI